MKRLTKRYNGVVTYIGTSNEHETGQIACEVDAQGVRELLERVAAYEDTTVTPLMCAEYKKFEDEAIGKGVTIKRIIELMDADAEERVAILPCEVGRAMLDVSDPEHPQEMKDVHFSVSYVSSGIVFSQPLNIFLENIAAGYIKSLEVAADAIDRR